MTTDTTKDLAKIREDLGDLREDIEALGVDLRELGSSRVRSARNRAQRAGKRARSQLDSVQANVEHEIEEHPITSVLASFGVGFVVGMLLDRRR